jgi:hypothetical protein
VVSGISDAFLTIGANVGFDVAQVAELMGLVVGKVTGCDKKVKSNEPACSHCSFLVSSS